jgi:enoyl-CoA hydratase/carnithine racemase
MVRAKTCILTLNRPKALNSLDTAMCADLKSLLLQWRDEDEGRRPLLFVVKGAGDRSFCAGGDVKAVWQELQEMRTRSQSVGTGARGSLHVDFFRTEYEMNYLLATSLVPQISLWDGIVMGGGVGVSMYGRYRVATEKTVFAMPPAP